MKKILIPLAAAAIAITATGAYLGAQGGKAHPRPAGRRGADHDAPMRDHARHFNPDFKLRDLQRAIRQRKAILQHSRGRRILAANNGWKALGPTNIGGRTLAIYVDPGNSSHILIGTAGGGIWNTTDGGQSWNPVNDFMGSLAVNAIARDPTSGALYAGTGEYDAGDGMEGAGVFMSTDNGTSWQALSSTNPNSDSHWFYTNGLAINPNGVILAATWSGLMRSTDGGQSWTQTYSGLTGDVHFDPNDPSKAIMDVSPTWWASGVSSSYVAYSTDAGQSWTRVELASGGSQSLTVNSPASVQGNYSVGGADFNPGSANITQDLAEVKDGSGQISTGCTTPFANASAVNGHIAVLVRGGCTFVAKAQNAQNAGAVGVIVVDDVSEPLFTMGGTNNSITIPSLLVKKSDGATLENAIAGGSTINATITVSKNPNGASGRVSLAYAKSAPGTVYAAVDYQEGTVYKSTDGGQSWTQTAVVKNSSDHLYDSGGGDQGGYDDPLWVDPADANHLVAGGINLWQSSDGGANWTEISDWRNTPISPHADHHALAYAGSTFYDGDDGGVYSTGNVSTATTTSGWTSLDNGLAVTQFYSVAGKASATSANNGGVAPVIGGTQDNGCEIYTGNAGAWSEYVSGDGGYTAVDPGNGDNLFCEYVYLTVDRSTDGGFSAKRITSGLSDANSSSTAKFIAPFVLDPNNSNTLLAGGISMWRSTNALASTPTWSSINGSTLPSGNFVTAITVAKGDSDDVWVGFDNGDVWHTGSGTASPPTWSQVNVPTPPSGGAINRIVVDPANHNSVYAMYETFGGKALWHSDDGGASWTNISTGLPNAPVFDLAIDPANANNLFVATEVGVFTSTDGGATWGTSNDGPADVRIVQFDWFDNSHLIAATHGRGMWEMSLQSGGGPTLSSLAPASATAGATGFTLTANGSGFTSGSTISFAGAPLQTTYVSSSQLKGDVPASDIAAPGSYNVKVSTAGGGISSAKTFTVNAAVPSLSSLAPSSATAGSGGFTLTVDGSDFESGATVTFGGSALSTTVVSATELQASVPASAIATAGNVSVTATNPGASKSNALTFKVNPAVPSISGLSPSNATAGDAGFTLTVNGSDFESGATVTFNGSALSTTVVSSTELQASVPASAIAAAGDMAVTASNPGSAASNALTFTVKSAGGGGAGSGGGSGSGGGGGGLGALALLALLGLALAGRRRH